MVAINIDDRGGLELARFDIDGGRGKNRRGGDDGVGVDNGRSNFVVVAVNVDDTGRLELARFDIDIGGNCDSSEIQWWWWVGVARLGGEARQKGRGIILYNM